MHMGVPNEQGVSTPEARRLGRVGADAVMRCSRGAQTCTYVKYGGMARIHTRDVARAAREPGADV